MNQATMWSITEQLSTGYEPGSGTTVGKTGKSLLFGECVAVISFLLGLKWFLCWFRENTLDLIMPWVQWRSWGWPLAGGLLSWPSLTALTMVLTSTNAASHSPPSFPFWWDLFFLRQSLAIYSSTRLPWILYVAQVSLKLEAIFPASAFWVLRL